MYIARILVDLGTDAKPSLCKVIFNYVVIFSTGKLSLAVLQSIISCWFLVQ